MTATRPWLATLVLAAASLPVAAASQEAGPQPTRYAVYNTGIVCRAAPCFSYCARNLGTNEVSRFSHWASPSLSADERQVLETMEPVIVEGRLRTMGGHMPPAVEMTVAHVIRRVPELGPIPMSCK